MLLYSLFVFFFVFHKSSKKCANEFLLSFAHQSKNIRFLKTKVYKISPRKSIPAKRRAFLIKKKTIAARGNRARVGILNFLI